MISLPNGLKVFVATKALDMRKSFDGMAAIVSQDLQQNIYHGHLFVFSNKRCDRVKIFYWDCTGYCYWYKRLEKGVFRFPKITDKVYKISSSELALLLEGIELTHRQRLRVC